MAGRGHGGSMAKWQQRQAEEQRFVDDPPASCTFRLYRFQGPQLTQFQSHFPEVTASVTSVLMLANVARDQLPLSRLMVKRAEPPIPNVWNHGGGLPQSMLGMLIPVSPVGAIQTEEMFITKATDSLESLGIPVDGITLVIDDSSFAQLMVSRAVTKSLVVQFLLMPPDEPDNMPAPPSLPTPPPLPTPPSLPTPPFSHTQPLMPPLMQSPSQHFTPLTPPTPPSAASSTSAPSPTPTVLAIEARVSALETQLQSVDSKLDRLLACMAAQAPADGPPARRQRTA